MSSFRASHSDASTGLYVPVHRRAPSTYASSSGSLSPMSSPASSSRALSPAPSLHAPVAGVYTPAQLLALASSPIVAQIEASHSVVDALRSVAPEVVQTRKQRKAAAWHARQSAPTNRPTHKRTSSRESQSHSESDEEKAVNWRRV